MASLSWNPRRPSRPHIVRWREGPGTNPRTRSFGPRRDDTSCRCVEENWSPHCLALLNAQRWHAKTLEIESRYRDGRLPLPPELIWPPGHTDGSHAFRDEAERWLTSRAGEGLSAGQRDTDRRNVRRLCDVLGELPLAEANRPEHLKTVLGRVRAAHEERTGRRVCTEVTNTVITTCNQILDHAVANDRLDRNKVRGAVKGRVEKRRSPKRPLDEDAYERLRAELAPPMDLFCDVMIGTGLRAQEMRGLKARQIHFYSDGRIPVVEVSTKARPSGEVVAGTKRGSEDARFVPLPPMLKAPLQKHIEHWRLEGDDLVFFFLPHPRRGRAKDLPYGVFRDRLGTGYVAVVNKIYVGYSSDPVEAERLVIGFLKENPDRCPRNMDRRRAFPHDSFTKKIWHPALERAGLDYHTPYDLRHSFASWLLHHGRATPFEIMELMGHSSVEMTRRYLQRFPEHIQRLAQKLWDEPDNVEAKPGPQRLGDLDLKDPTIRARILELASEVLAQGR